MLFYILLFWLFGEKQGAFHWMLNFCLIFWEEFKKNLERIFLHIWWKFTLYNSNSNFVLLQNLRPCRENLASPIEFGQFSTLHLAAASFRQDNFLSTKSMSFVGPSRAALIKSSKAKSDGDSFSWTVRHWCNIWNNTEQWLCFTCIWDFIINPVFVVCHCICIFDNHIVY